MDLTSDNPNIREITRRVYLGDSVYCFFDGYHFVLETRNGSESSNTIYLEPAVIEAFIERIKKVEEIFCAKNQVN